MLEGQADRGGTLRETVSCLYTFGCREHPVICGGSSGIPAWNIRRDGLDALVGPLPTWGAVRQGCPLMALKSHLSHCGFTSLTLCLGTVRVFSLLPMFLLHQEFKSPPP